MFEKAHRIRRTTAVRCALGAWVAAAGNIGCSGGNPYELIDVEGTVKYEDGSLIPADSIMVKFSPQAAPVDPKTHPRPAIASVNVSDGTFAFATTHKHADGIVAGKHKVLVIAYGKGGKGTDVVPKEYEHPATTPVEIDASESPLEIKVQKPKGRA
jgi:hypothetical protein